MLSAVVSSYDMYQNFDSKILMRMHAPGSRYSIVLFFAFEMHCATCTMLLAWH